MGKRYLILTGKNKTFQATEMVKKEGIEAAIDKVRVHLNKITEGTFDRQKEAHSLKFKQSRLKM